MPEFERKLPTSPDMAVIRDPSMFSSLFRGEYAPVVTNLNKVLGGASDNVYSVVHSQTIHETLTGINKLFGDDGQLPEGGLAIQRAVYKPFAFKQGFTQKTEWGPGVLPIAELDRDQQAVWQTYLQSLGFIEQKRGLVAAGIKDIIFPTVSIKYDKAVNIPLAATLEQAKRKIVAELIPNITDEEAKVALGLRYTGDIVRAEITPEWFMYQ